MMRSRVEWLVVPLIALAYVIVELQWAHSIVWDEVEFFRATRRVAEGRVPFRDFWEHHLPLQWYLFAPFSALFGRGPGVASVLAMRWIQLPCWFAAFALLFAIMRRAAIEKAHAGIALLLVAASPLWIRAAVEYRLDTLGTLFFLAALALAILRPDSRAAWIGFGGLMSASVMANMRMMPLVVAAAILLFFLRIDERRWRWNRIALWMLPGVAIAAALFGIWVLATGTWKPLQEAMRYNVVSNRLLVELARTFRPVLFSPFTVPDFGAIALFIASAIGTWIALRDIRRPHILQLCALLMIASVIFISRFGVHYIYHFQITWLLMAPLATLVLRSELAEHLIMLFVAVVVSVNLGRLLPPDGFLAYQDAVMREADRRSLPTERVFDGVGYALRREPAYRYWFLPSGVRLMALRGLIEPYDAPEMIARPPALIVHSYRVNLWLRAFPRAAAYATRHYLPLYRDLWIPGLNAVVQPGRRVTWIAPRGGRYRIYASELLDKHPWFRQPLNYARFAGQDATLYTVRLADVPLADMTRMNVIVDRARVAGRTFALRRGSLVTVESSWARPTAVVIIPDDVPALFVAPPEAGVM